MIYHPISPPESWKRYGIYRPETSEKPQRMINNKIREMIRWANLWNKILNLNLSAFFG